MSFLAEKGGIDLEEMKEQAGDDENAPGMKEQAGDDKNAEEISRERGDGAQQGEQDAVQGGGGDAVQGEELDGVHEDVKTVRAERVWKKFYARKHSFSLRRF